MFSSGWLVVFDGGVLITIAYIYIYVWRLRKHDK